MRIPDWLIYLAVICAIVWILFRLDDPKDQAPPSMPGTEAIGPVLPPASVFDPEVLVDVGKATSGVGTTFAIDTRGWWLTARHVVADCKDVGIIVGRRAAVRVKAVKTAPFADIALLKTDKAPVALALDLREQQLHLGQLGYHVGFPQGRQGEAVSRLYRREKLIAHGRFSNEEPVLAWAELGRTQGLIGSLSGISGGPVFNAEGKVIGVTIAEQTRRGRLYTASQASIQKLLTLNNVEPQGEPAPSLTRANYGPRSDQLRRSLAVAQVVCVADDMAPAEDVP